MGRERERGGESRRRARESMWRESGEGEGRGRKLQGRPLEEEVPHISALEGNCTDTESGRCCGVPRVRWAGRYPKRFLINCLVSLIYFPGMSLLKEIVRSPEAALFPKFHPLLFIQFNFD